MKPSTSKNQTPPPPPPPPPKFNPDEFVTMTIPREEVIQIKQAFDIFDGDGSGMIDPS